MEFIKHKFRPKRAIILRNAQKEIFMYVLQTYTPNTKRVLYSEETTNTEEVNKFLEL